MARDGRTELRKFNVLTWLKVLPGFLQQFDKQVPDEMWSQDVDQEGDPIAVVACVCGAEPKVYYGGLEECGCGRWFLWVADKIKVARFEEGDDRGEEGEES